MLREDLPYTREFLAAQCEAYGWEVGKYTYGEPIIRWWGEPAKLHIGRFCAIADRVMIYLGGEHRSDWVTTFPFNAIDDTASDIGGHPKTKGDVRIGHDVWLADDCKIMSGVTIGNGACVAAGAVVTRLVPPYAIVGGVPAKIIRLRFTREQIAALENIQWWNWPLTRIRTMYPLLLSPMVDAFIEAAQEWREPNEQL